MTSKITTNKLLTDNVLINVNDLLWEVNGKSILNHLSFSVSKGEFVGIIGPNGAGKSSLLRCLYRKIIATSGSIAYNQKALTEYSRKQLAQNIAVVLQEPPTHFVLTVIDVIRMGLIPNKSLLSFDNDDDEQAIIDAAHKVDLFDKLHQPFNALSGGEKQRAMIARAVLQKPTLLLMDEPTNHLDIKHQIEVLELARSMDTTVMLSIHDLNLAANFCDRIILMNQGEIVANGTPVEVFTSKRLKQVFDVEVDVSIHIKTQKLRIHFDLDAIDSGTIGSGSVDSEYSS